MGALHVLLNHQLGQAVKVGETLVSQDALQCRCRGCAIDHVKVSNQLLTLIAICGGMMFVSGKDLYHYD